MRGERHQSIFLWAALLLLVFFLFETLSYGQSNFSGIQKTFQHPRESVRAVMLVLLSEAGAEVDGAPSSSEDIGGRLVGFPFSLHIEALNRSTTRLRLAIKDPHLKESQVLETVLMNILTQRLSRRADAKKKSASFVSPASVYEVATVCLYGSNDNETFQSSGIVISREGMVLTTAHEISAAHVLFIKWPDKEVTRGEIVLKSDLFDLALVTTGRATENFVALPEPESLDITAGKVVYELGCPYGLMGTLSRGRTAAAPRMVGGILLFQCDMFAYPGNSGGPVFDKAGNLLGLVKGRLKDTNNISFVIPSFYLSLFVKQNLKKKIYKTPTGTQSDDWISWFGLGLAASQEREKEHAFRRVLSLRPGFIPALYHLGLLLTKDKRLKEELLVWKRLVNQNVGWSEAWYRLGNALFKSDRLRDAEKAYLQAIKLSSDDQRYYNNLGELYRREGKFRKAEIYFRKALSHNPHYAMAHYNLGVLCDQEMGRPELAVYHYRQYLKLRLGAPDRNQVEKWIKDAEKRF